MNDRDLLARLIAGPASGSELARAAGLTRAAVWKQVQALRAAGLAIEASPGQGYVLRQPPQLLDADAILAKLPSARRTLLAALDVCVEIPMLGITR